MSEMKWFLSFSICFIFRVVADGSVSSFLTAELYSIVHIFHIFFIQASFEGHFSCFHVFTAMNDAAINIAVHVSL